MNCFKAVRFVNGPYLSESSPAWTINFILCIHYSLELSDPFIPEMLLIFISWTIKPSRDQSGFPSRPQFSAGVECTLFRKPCQTSDSIENALLYSPICCLSSLLNHILDRTDTLVGPAWKTLSPSEGVYQVAHWKRILLPVQETQVKGFNPWVRKIPWRRQWQPTPVFLPGESHGQRSLVGYSPWGHKDLDTTEHTAQGPCTRLWWLCSVTQFSTISDLGQIQQPSKLDPTTW